MIEKRIYNTWAYSKDEKEKGEMNLQIYNELNSKYKIAFGTTIHNSTKIWNSQSKCYTDIDFDKYDIVVKYCGFGHGCIYYKIIKNSPNLSMDEIALICDKGNLCFGYAIRNHNEICVYID